MKTKIAVITTLLIASATFAFADARDDAERAAQARQDQIDRRLEQIERAAQDAERKAEAAAERAEWAADRAAQRGPGR